MYYMLFCLFHTKSLKSSVLFSANSAAQRTTFQVLNSHTQLVATVLDNIVLFLLPSVSKGL